MDGGHADSPVIRRRHGLAEHEATLSAQAHLIVAAKASTPKATRTNCGSSEITLQGMEIAVIKCSTRVESEPLLDVQRGMSLRRMHNRHRRGIKFYSLPYPHSDGLWLKRKFSTGVHTCLLDAMARGHPVSGNFSAFTRKHAMLTDDPLKRCKMHVACKVSVRPSFES